MANSDPGLSESKSHEETKKPSRTESRRAGPTDPRAREEEQRLDFSLRPRALAEFVGQERLKQVLGMSIEATRKRGEPYVNAGVKVHQQAKAKMHQSGLASSALI